MNHTNECKKCHILSSQLQEAVTELKSAQFIIKLLQDEVNKSSAPRGGVEGNRQDISEFSRQEWKSASSRYSNKFASRFKYITPQDIKTKNRFEVLSGIQSLTGNAQGKVSGKTNFFTKYNTEGPSTKKQVDIRQQCYEQVC